MNGNLDEGPVVATRPEVYEKRCDPEGELIPE